MSKPPRSIALPLDLLAATDRAQQIAALADADHLRVLSAIAGGTPADELGQQLDLPADRIGDALEVLREARLLSADPEPQLTADAWVRFGRLLSGNGTTVAHPLPTAPSSAPLPPVADRIARDLSYRFSSVFSAETVTKYVAESYALLSERARVTNHLPSLTARFATDRLSALATAEGLVLRGTPEVLFVCVQNAGRSQIASAALRQIAGDRVHVRTAGSAPASVVHPDIVDILDEIGIPIAAEFPKPLTNEVVQAADYVITMGCGDACPIYPGRRYMDWELDDPVGLDRAGMRRVRDEIVSRVRALVAEMGLTSSETA